MKKFAILSICAICMFFSPAAKADSIGEKLLLYIPNRICDLLDIFSVSIGIGPTVRAELMATELVKVGAGIDFGTARLYKEWNRQYGFGLQKGWYWSFVCAGEENQERWNTLCLVDEVHERRAGVPTPDMPIYDYYLGQRDFWKIGGALGLIVEGEVYINPVEWLDLAAGFLLIDLRQDDIELSDFSR